MKIDVIPNGLEKYMVHFLNSAEFINSRLDKLVKNLSDDDFKYLAKEVGSKN